MAILLYQTVILYIFFLRHNFVYASFCSTKPRRYMYKSDTCTQKLEIHRCQYPAQKTVNTACLENKMISHYIDSLKHHSVTFDQSLNL